MILRDDLRFKIRNPKYRILYRAVMRVFRHIQKLRVILEV